MSRPDFDVLDLPTQREGAKEIHVFMDTEFTSFTHPELISIGLASAHSDAKLYLEVAEVQDMVVSEFVREEVLPLLGMHDPEILPYDRLAARLEGWFDELRAGDRETSIVLLSDSSVDWTLVSELKIMSHGPTSWMRSINVVGRLIQHYVENGRHWQSFLEEVEKFHIRIGVRHNALVDARGLKSAYFKSLEALDSQ